MNFGKYGIFEWNVLVSSAFQVVVLLFMVFLVVKLYLHFKHTQNIIAGSLYKAIGFIVLGYIVPAVGIAIGGTVHQQNIFEYAHFYSTLPFIIFTSVGAYWFYKTASAISVKNETKTKT